MEDASAPSDLNIADLKEDGPKSDWERYFCKVVACDDSYLNKRWTELYDLRCLNAHNALVTRVDYERIAQLVGEVSEQLKTAVNNIDRVHVPPDEKERIVKA